MYNKSDLLLSDFFFVSCLVSSVACTTPNPTPPDPRRPLHMLCIYVATVHYPKSILGLGGKGSKNKQKDADFIFPMTNIMCLSIFRMHAQEENFKLLELKYRFISLIF